MLSSVMIFFYQTECFLFEKSASEAKINIDFLDFYSER